MFLLIILKRRSRIAWSTARCQPRFTFLFVLIFVDTTSSATQTIIDMANKKTMINNIQGVHKVFLQFKKIITKRNDEISQLRFFLRSSHFNGGSVHITQSLNIRNFN